MNEYEFMMLAVDEVISHDIAAVICMENYKNCYLPRGFRKAFDLFCELRKGYEQNKEILQDEEKETMAVARLQTECRIKREEILSKFILELKNIEPEIDYEKAIEQYLSKMGQEDIQTIEMQLMMYPYLISLIREREEKVDNYD